MAEWLHSPARVKGDGYQESMAERGCEGRDKENIHFWDKHYHSGGTWQELPQVALPWSLLSHCAMMEELHHQALSWLPDTRCQGEHRAQPGS